MSEPIQVDGFRPWYPFDPAVALRSVLREIDNHHMLVDNASDSGVINDADYDLYSLADRIRAAWATSKPLIPPSSFGPKFGQDDG